MKITLFKIIFNQEIVLPISYAASRRKGERKVEEEYRPITENKFKKI